jgi:nicotinamide-nucleotide amidase
VGPNTVNEISPLLETPAVTVTTNTVQRLEIIVIGDELLDGRTHEKNSYYLARQCRIRGLELARVTFIDDEPATVREALLEAAERVELIVTSGGIGPTRDDRTRLGIAKAAGSELKLDVEVRERLAEKYRTRGRVMNDANLRQAYFPEGALVLPSAVGTADAFEVSVGDAKVVCLPGVPAEFRELVEKYVLDRHTNTKQRQYRRFHLFGEGESFFAERIEALQLPSCLKITYNAHFPVVDIELSTEDKIQVLEDAALHIEHELLPWLFEASGRQPAETLVHELKSHGLTVATAESCTGGWVASAITDISGASDVLDRAVVTYSNEAKEQVLGVSYGTLVRDGAVAATTAEEMAEGVRTFAGADVGIALTGIAGPTGGTEEKPVGTVYISVATPDRTVVVHAQFRKLDRLRFKKRAGTTAIMMAIRQLQDRMGNIQHFTGVKSCTITRESRGSS